MKKIYLSELMVGVKEELEHKDVTGGNLLTTAKIALAHLKEDEHYYTKLKKVGLIQNPIRHIKKGWYWGSKGPFTTREHAVKVAQAVHASGWKENPHDRQAYYCSICNKTHNIKSKIGKQHLKVHEDEYNRPSKPKTKLT